MTATFSSETTATPTLKTLEALASVNQQTSKQEDRLKCLTFNIWAPCYKRIPVQQNNKSGASSLNRIARKFSLSTSLITQREAVFESLFLERNIQIVQLLHHAAADLVCLQEFWFNPKIHNLFENKLDSRFSFHYLKRTGTKQDGLATLVSRERFDVIGRNEIQYNDKLDRVALVLHLQTKGDEKQDLIVVNTHLAFPHHCWDVKTQNKQMTKLVEEIALFQERCFLQQAPVVIMGDFNSSRVDCHPLRQASYESSFFVTHRRDPGATHLTHMNQQVSVDHIWVSENEMLIPQQSYLIPRDLADDSWQQTFHLSDHRPLVTEFKFLDRKSVV